MRAPVSPPEVSTASRLSAEAMDHLRSVYAAPAGGFAVVKDVTAVFKYQAIRP